MKPPIEDQEFHHRRAGHGNSHDGRTRRDHVVTSTVVVGVALFLLVGTPYLKRHLSQEGTVVNSIGGRDVSSERESGREDRRDSARDGDREAVRRWLRDNDDPHFHEIRWWPARELGRLYQERLEAARQVAQDDPTLADEVGQLDEDGPDRVCRLKYRTTNEAGDEITRDDLFVVRQGKARLLAKDSSLAIAARKSFPDGEDVR